MKLEGIAATTGVDRHNCKITKEVLENAVEMINTGSFVPSIGLEHDSSLMPIGKTYKAKLVQLENDEYPVLVYRRFFIIFFTKD